MNRFSVQVAYWYKDYLQGQGAFNQSNQGEQVENKC